MNDRDVYVIRNIMPRREKKEGVLTPGPCFSGWNGGGHHRQNKENRDAQTRNHGRHGEGKYLSTFLCEEYSVVSSPYIETHPTIKKHINSSKRVTPYPSQSQYISIYIHMYISISISISIYIYSLLE